jgi:putative addiction module killer protein
MELGNAGDSRSVGGGVMEMRTDHGPGYRVYFISHGSSVVILLCGGDKRRQQQDIERAQALARDMEEW